jgi:hypothetical protein
VHHGGFSLEAMPFLPWGALHNILLEYWWIDAQVEEKKMGEKKIFLFIFLSPIFLSLLLFANRRTRYESH